jgi:microcystin-dependent protein
MPLHSHPFQGTISKLCTAAAGDSDTPQNHSPAMIAGTEMYSTTTDGSLMAPMQHNLTVGFSTGGGQAFNTTMPVLGLTPIICLAGLYPVRN